MKILLNSSIFPDSFGRNIAVSAEGMGHSVRVVESFSSNMYRGRYRQLARAALERAFPALAPRWARHLVHAAREFDPDLILLTYGLLSPATVDELRRVTQAKIVLWYPDALVNLGRQYPLVYDLDAWFFKDPYMARTFRDKLGINAHYLPEACNPVWHRPAELTAADLEKYGCDLATASNMYYYRARSLEMFKDYDLKIWGKNYPAWLSSPLREKCTHVYVGELEKSKALRAAKIVLNTMHYGEIEGVNCRLFEAAGCGAFQIADWKSALAELFEPEYEIVTFRTREELKRKVDYYLGRPAERQAIAGRACARAHREHTYELRLETIFQTVGLVPEPRVQSLRA